MGGHGADVFQSRAGAQIGLLQSTMFFAASPVSWRCYNLHCEEPGRLRIPWDDGWRGVEMGWLNFFKGRKAGSSANMLRDSLFDASATGDGGAFDKMCHVNRGRILEEFESWLKVPEALRADPQAVARYAQGLAAVAEWSARNGAPQLLNALQGEGRDNPIVGWQDRFGEADTLKIQGRFAEAIDILDEFAKDMSEHRGTAVEKYLPMVHGSRGESFFRSGDFDRAYEATRAALDGCQRSGDIEGIIAYCGNLAETCDKRGKANEARYWLIVTTNAMIQTGQEQRAAQVRREHGLGPPAGLIKVKVRRDESITSVANGAAGHGRIQNIGRSAFEFCSERLTG